MNSVNVVERDGQAVVVGANFAEVFRTKSFFHWLVRGCSELFTQMPSVLRNENRIGRYYRRDPKAISFACRDINAKCFDPAFWTGMENLDYSFSVVADLGCGSGERLIQLAERYPGTKGIGLDNAGPSLETAASDVAAAGLTDRITFGELDVRSMAPRQEFDEVDLLTCFMMGHDFWPRESCVATLRRLRELFPNARRMLLGDKTRTVGVPDGEQEIFTLGFEVAHAMMNVYIPTLEEWEGVFGDGGWKCVRKTTVQGLASSVVFELE
ncbi:class I SAM-dependent methyltransferase [Streptosporangium sp. NPDC051023]|uniref:SAM-dependent methyltransferase n=1 Tax=Streptosporangium sp. NPDC051023 TaxID=3155410 RepID=UPI0034504E0D